MAEVCQRVLHGFGMPVEWAVSTVQIFRVKGDIRNDNSYLAMMFLEHGRKVVEWVLGKRLHGVVTANEMQFG